MSYMQKTLILPSATLAFRAHDLLAGEKIASRAVRLRVEAGQTAPPGCGWGLELDASRVAEATRILARAGIAASIGGSP